MTYSIPQTNVEWRYQSGFRSEHTYVRFAKAARGSGCAQGSSLSVILASLLLVIGSSMTAHGTDYMRAAPGGGSFHDVFAWSPFGVPGSDDRAIFNLSSSYTVDFFQFGVPTDVTNHSLLVHDDSVTLNPSGATYSLTSEVLLGGPFLNQSQFDDHLRLINGAVTTQNAIVGGSSGIGVVPSVGGGAVTTQNGKVSSSSDSTVVPNMGGGRLEVGSGGVFSSDGLLSIGAGTSGTLTINSGGQVNSFLAAVGQESTGSANINGNNSTWISDTLDVGGNANGTLNIQDGGHVTTTDDTEAFIGVSSSATGNVNVSESGSQWSHAGPFVVGDSGSGNLDISGGGDVMTSASSATTVVGDSSNSDGDVTVDGSNSRWRSTGTNHTLTVGDAGASSLTITGGGNVSFSRTLIGAGSLGSGTVDVEGTNSRLNSFSGVFVGGNQSAGGGSGTLTIGPGAEVMVGEFFSTKIWSPGTLSLNGGTLETGQLELAGGAFNWNSGTLILSGSELRVEPGGLFGSSLVIGADKHLEVVQLLVGETGNGTLQIISGGTVSNNSVSIGSSSTSSGSVTISGPGSGWSTGGTLTVGQSGEAEVDIGDGAFVDTTYLSVGREMGSEGTVNVDEATMRVVTGVAGQGTSSIGRAGTGTLNIGPDAVVETEWNHFALGETEDGDGTVNVTGPNATWMLGGAANDLTVAQEGTGRLEVSAGGTIISGKGTVGYAEDSNGVVQIEGQDAMDTPSSWHPQFLDVGRNGFGEVTINDGGLLQTQEMFVGSGNMGEGHVTVSGEESRLRIEAANNANIVLGGAGMAFLDVTSAGSVDAEDLFIGDGTGGMATATVVGPGSSVANVETVVGYGGAGTLMLGDGASLTSDVAAMAVMSTATGTATVQGSNASWQIDDSLYVGGDQNLVGGTADLTIDNGGIVQAEGTVRIWQQATVDLTGGTLAAHTIDHTHGGDFAFTDGRLEVVNFQGTLVNQGGTLAPGASPAMAAISNDYVQSAAATLEIELAGDDNSDPMNPQFDTLAVGEIAVLDGALQVSLSPDYTPAAGTQFKILTAGTALAGQFAEERLPTLADGGDLAWNLQYNTKDVTLEVLSALLGDLDGDVDVDFDDINDLVLGLNDPQEYQNQFGVPPEMNGDVDGDGDLDFDDIDDFVGILNNPLSARTQTIPEPGTAMLLGMAMSVLALCGMLRQHTLPQRPSELTGNHG